MRSSSSCSGAAISRSPGYEMDPADGQLSLDDDPEVPWDEDEDEEGGSCAF